MKRALVRAAIALSAAAVALAVLSAARAGLYDVDRLAREVPQRTALMRARSAAARRAGRAWRPRQAWVPYERISPLLRHAVLTAEDAAFYQHGGLDWSELRAAARRDLEERRVVRGGSTITQQLAKNLYLGDRRTVTRKLTEVFVALRMERALSKRRIFELYLNLIEWGDGVFGAEAAARHYFGVSAADLSPRQATLLAAVIINPRRFSVLAPSRRIERRVRMIAGRMHRRGALDDAQYAQALGLPPPAPPDSAAPGAPDTAVARAGAVGGPLSPPASP
jgi:monofunctional glycosyltransferase